MSLPRRSLALAAVLGLATLLAPSARATVRVHVEEGERNVQFEPIKGDGKYVRCVFVYGVTRQKVLDCLPGPATGPNGFAPKMVTETPIEQQFVDGVTHAEKMRLPGLPAVMGATVEGRRTADGMAFTMRDGLTYGDFTLTVSPERTTSDGSLEVKVTEAGSFSILKSKPKSLLGVPAYLFSNWTPMGWFMQGVSGAVVSKAHIFLFQLEDVLRRRLGARD
ncbi:MAG: hypothetical protein HY303_08615 [Candidatus Wallbacteria bacterium]|nr:hypothetical protein [Candidatus Wallbacteria bacterium]